jgi:hypothetical protein
MTRVFNPDVDKGLILAMMCVDSYHLVILSKKPTELVILSETPTKLVILSETKDLKS